MFKQLNSDFFFRKIPIVQSLTNVNLNIVNMSRFNQIELNKY